MVAAPGSVPRGGGPPLGRWQNRGDGDPTEMASRDASQCARKAVSRRDALRASALRGPTNAEAFHLHPMMRPEACGLPGTCLGQADAFLSGRAEPAPPRGLAQHEWRCRENSEMTRKAVFSEGRTLCVRVARPHKCQGIPFLPLDDARGRWPTGHMSRSTPRLPCGRAEPANPPCSPDRLSHQLPTPGKRTSWQRGLFWSILQRGLSWMSPHEGASRGSCGLGKNILQEKGSSHEHIYREKGRNSLRPTPDLTPLWTSAMEEGGG